MKRVIATYIRFVCVFWNNFVDHGSVMMGVIAAGENVAWVIVGTSDSYSTTDSLDIISLYRSGDK